MMKSMLLVLHWWLILFCSTLMTGWLHYEKPCRMWQQQLPSNRECSCELLNSLKWLHYFRFYLCVHSLPFFFREDFWWCRFLMKIVDFTVLAMNEFWWSFLVLKGFLCSFLRNLPCRISSESNRTSILSSNANKRTGLNPIMLKFHSLLIPPLTNRLCCKVVMVLTVTSYAQPWFGVPRPPTAS